MSGFVEQRIRFSATFDRAGLPSSGTFRHQIVRQGTQQLRPDVLPGFGRFGLRHRGGKVPESIHGRGVGVPNYGIFYLSFGFPVHATAFGPDTIRRSNDGTWTDRGHLACRHGWLMSAMEKETRRGSDFLMSQSLQTQNEPRDLVSYLP